MVHWRHAKWLPTQARRSGPTVGLLVVLCFGVSPELSAQDDDLPAEFNRAYSNYQDLVASHRYEDAIPFARQALELGARLYRADDRRIPTLTLNLGTCLRRSDHPDEAVSVLKVATELFEEQFGDDALELVDPLVELGHATAHKRGNSPYRQYYDRALRIVAAHAGKNSVLYGDIAMEVGQEMLFGARELNGRNYLFLAHDIFLAKLGPDDRRTGMAVFNLAKFHMARKNSDAALPLLNEALRVMELVADPADPTDLVIHAFLVDLLEQNGNTAAAQEHLLAISRIAASRGGGAVIPLVQREPAYPAAAAQTVAEGFVDVEFTVDETGRVRDAQVLHSEGHRAFDAAALDAAGKFRFAPRYENGEFVATNGVRHHFYFSLPNASTRKRCELAMTLYRATTYPFMRMDGGRYSPIAQPLIPPECQ